MQTLLIVDDDTNVGLGLAVALERNGRRIIVCRDLESAQIMLDSEPVTDIITDVKLSGPFRFEGLEFITEIMHVAPSARVILMTGHSSPELVAEAERRGADAVLSKPFGTTELEPLLSEASGDEEPSLVIVPTLDEVIAGDLRPRFQPIVLLSDRSIHGVESLARFRGGEPFDRPDLLFAYATRRKGVAPLEAACVETTMRAAVTFHESIQLFLNIHPAALEDIGIAATLAASARQNGIDLSRVVLEITEQQELRHTPSLVEAIEQLRTLGVRFAFDDVGVAYSHLPLIEKIRPTYLKISQLFGTQFESDQTKLKIIRNIVALGAEFGCDVIIEGIEDESSEVAARDLGIKFGQGYLFGRPADAPASGAET